MFTPAELAAEHARAMRIVKAVLAACDARAATARAAREHGFKPGDAPWVLAIGKAAIGMAEGIKDVCGEPQRHLIVTVNGPVPGSLANILRSDHPLPTQRSLDAGQAVKRFIEEAKAAGAPSLTVLMSGGASSLICEPIPGIDLDDYRAVVSDMLAAGCPIDRMNTVRRAIDGLKGGGLGEVANPLPISLLVISDVIGDALHDIGSGPFVQSPSSADHAAAMIERSWGGRHSALLTALSCRPLPPRVNRPARVIVAMNNTMAVHAAARAVELEGIVSVSDRWDLARAMQQVGASAKAALIEMQPGEGLAWGGEWDVVTTAAGFGGRAQSVAISLRNLQVPAFVLCFATDGIDGTAPPGRQPAAGACVWTSMFWPGDDEQLGPHPTPGSGEESEHHTEWMNANSYQRLAHRDAVRPPHEPPAHIFTGPTGTNVNDLLIAWRVK